MQIEKQNCWFILNGSFCFDKNTFISGNFHNKDIVFLEDFQKNIMKYIFQYGKN
jgi:hypothetical protein